MADLQRFVSTTGVDTPGNGTAAKPFRTIQNAAKSLTLAAGDTGKIFVEPGVYEEVVVLTDGMQLLRSDSTDEVTVDIAKELYTEKGPPVRIRRPRPASAPDTSSSAPTWPEVIKIHGKNIVVRGVIVDGDNRPQRGLFIHDSGNVTITGCLITAGRSKIINTGKGTGTEADPFHSEAVDEGEGAGLRIFNSKKVTFTNCVFNDNRTDLKFKQELTDQEIATLESSKTYKAADTLGQISDDDKKKIRQAVPVRDGGGHVSCFNADEITFDTCHFEDGFAGGRGGALQFAHNAYGKCVSCLFRGNQAGVDGGAVASSDPDPDFYTRKLISFTDCKFKTNTSGDDGGAVYLTTKTQAALRNCLFEDNESRSNGGALRVTYGSSVSLENCTFRGNRANIDAPIRLEKNQDGGGAIAVNNSSLSMKGGRVENNTVTGFAGGGLYFITAAFSKMAETLADLTHGYTFEKILKNGYGVTSVELKLADVVFMNNNATGETCNAKVCSLSPKSGFESRGAGGAIYALESLDKFNVPVTVSLNKVVVVANLSQHVEDRQRADLVVRNVTKLTISGTSISPHGSNKYAASFIDVDDGDLSSSPQFNTAKANGKIFESGGSIKYS
jgi:predicted outer membrane repeat protein